jgi:hypothetical protein
VTKSKSELDEALERAYEMFEELLSNHPGWDELRSLRFNTKKVKLTGTPAAVELVFCLIMPIGLLQSRLIAWCQEKRR